ncbi:disulfide bond formation protein B [Pseudorhodoplanes sp.]|uniref:disulfide bond formation protein B n=1 Tax=Pseudorhodoplanes sp. TaxID=1934341 RepID=UPI002C75930E|nr:disulfide bond formation protein B [Pseudorhodoplanes sp.]HWV52320.1 disulfide bond formation protein B [Pseudorhodoplanes sp.]
MNDLAATLDHMKRNEPVRLAAGTVAILGLATILGAWFFQLVMRLPPCPLCLEQRYAYYFSIPLAVLVLLGVSYGASRKVLTAALVVIALAMLWNAGLGGYHAGVEWKFWEGPRDCSGGLGDLGTAGGLLESLKTIRVVRCDEIPWSFLGISLAGYNAIISLVLSLIAAWGAWRAWQTLPLEERVV